MELIIEVKKIAEQIGIRGRILSYRPYGKAAKEVVLSMLATLPSGSAIVLDFKNVDVCDVSFVDEIVVQVQRWLIQNKENLIMYITNINESIFEEMQAAIALNEKKEGRIPVLSRTAANTFLIIGTLEDNLNETFNTIVVAKKITAREIAERFSIAINSASNRLKKLYDYRLLLREEQIDATGKQHIYILP